MIAVRKVFKFAALSAVFGIGLSVPGHPATAGRITTALPVQAGQATMVAQVSGTPAAGIKQVNDTVAKYQFDSGDLGITWDNGRGQVMTAYGDSYGNGFTVGPGGGPGNSPDHRCSALALSSDTNLADGMTIDTMIQDTPGHARTLLPCAGAAVIPTAGTSVGSRDYLAYMNVSRWTQPSGTWQTSSSEIAYSDNNGQTWAVSPNATWTNNSSSTDPFQQAAFVHRDGYVYMYGTPNGRYGNAYLARVPDGSILIKADYQYWTLNGWQTNNEALATPIVTGPVAELSVQYNTGLNRWLMTYLDQQRNAIVLRSATSPVGPWSGEQLILKSASLPGGIYGGFMHPWSTGNDLYLTVSLWNPYQVFLMHVSLAAGSGSENLISNPGFEDDQGDGNPPTNQVNRGLHGWSSDSGGGIDLGLGNAHQGSNEGFVSNDSDTWNDLYQTVAVLPHHDYTLSGWLRTSSNTNAAYFGARDTAQTTHWEIKLGSISSYTQYQISFNSGSNSLIQVYAGTWPPGSSAWIEFDDLSLTLKSVAGDDGFENQTTRTVSAPWAVEGADSSATGIDIGKGSAEDGANNAFIRTSSRNWNALTQYVPVLPDTDYTLTGWIKTSAAFGTGYFGVRPDGSNSPKDQTSYGSTNLGWQELTVPVSSGNNDFLTIFAGFWAPGSDSWVQLDDIDISRA